MIGARSRWGAAAAVAALAFAGASSAYAASGSGGGGTATGGGGGGTATGGGGGGGGGTATGGSGGGGGKAATCAVFSSLSASTAATGWGLQVSWTLATCARRPRVSVTVTNVATGVVEFGSYLDASAGSITYAGAGFSTAYRVDATVTSPTDAIVQGTGSVTATTGAATPGCTTFTSFQPSVGYWGVTAAIWIPWQTTGCITGRETVLVSARNLTSGVEELHYYSPSMQGLLDFEGTPVSYDTDYLITVEAHGMGGEITDTRSTIVHTPIQP